MSGWRDEVSPEVRDDLDRAIDSAIDHAHGLMRQSRQQPSFTVEEGSHSTTVAVKGTRGHGTDYLVIEAEHRAGGPRVMTVIDYKRRGLFRRDVSFGPRHESLMERRDAAGSHEEKDRRST